MWTWVRAVFAAVAGATLTITLGYLGAVVLLVARTGIPLGSEGWHPTSVEYVVLLLIGGAAAAIGGHIAAGTAREHSGAVVIVLTALLAVGALWGFSNPASQWPPWWAPVLAAVTALGTWLGGAILRPGRKTARRRY